MTIDLRLGRWQDVLADVGEVDTLISDPPYSERTHRGHDDGTCSANKKRTPAQLESLLAKASAGGRGCKKLRENQGETRRTIAYGAFSPADVEEFVCSWSPRVRGWFVVMTDHVLVPVYERALEAAGRYVFSPLAFVHPGRGVRLAGDGPAQWSVSIVVSRPRGGGYHKLGSLPGAYVLPPKEEVGSGERFVGGKPLWLMRALVRDYSRPGDLICDPCAGGATTLLASRLEERRAIGSEMDEPTHRRALARCSDLPIELAGERQTVLFG